MARTITVAAAALIATAALCFSALVGVAQAADKDNALVVDGKVFCDTCRVKFQTHLSEPIEGAKVKLVCRDRETDEISLEKEEETDKLGQYKFDVDGDHTEEICEVHLVKSPREDCNEIAKGWNSARILLSTEVGMVDSARHANALGFLKKEALKGCADALDALGFLPI